MRLTRRRLLGGAAAGALAAAGIYELVDQLAGSPQRTAAGGAASGAAPARRARGRRRRGRRGARAAAAPRGRHRDAPYGDERGRAAGGAGRARGGAARARRAVRGDAGRARRHGGAGGSRTSAATWRRRLRGTCRSTCGQRRLRASECGRSRTRSASPATRRRRCSRRTTWPSFCAATRSTRSPTARVRCSRSSTGCSASRASGAASSAAASTGRAACRRRWRWPPASPGPTSFPTRRSSSSVSRRRRRPASGPSRIANFETLGYVDLGPGKYFAHGTHMHVSHLFENLEAWYLNFDHRERVDTTFRPGLDVPVEKLTVPQGPDDVQTHPGRVRGLRGHATYRAQRLDPAVVAAGGGRDRPRRNGIREGHGDPPARGLQHARQPVLLDGRQGPRRVRAASRPPACTSSSSTLERRLQAQPPGDGRHAAGRDGAARSSRAPAARASTPCCRRRTARTSSCRRARTGRSRSPSFAPSRARAAWSGRSARRRP